MLVQVTDRDYGVRRLTMATDTIALPEAERKRVDAERARVARALAKQTPVIHWRPPFVKPGGGIVTSGFGRRTFVNGKPRPQPHLGVDFRAAYGVPVKAPAAGRVVLAEDHYLPGKSVYIDHGRGLFSAFYHLSEFKVQAGEFVEKGRTIALAGNTGASTTGPHLHYGLYLNKTWINPLAFQEATEAIRKDF